MLDLLPPLFDHGAQVFCVSVCVRPTVVFKDLSWSEYVVLRMFCSVFLCRLSCHGCVCVCVCVFVWGGYFNLQVLPRHDQDQRGDCWYRGGPSDVGAEVIVFSRSLVPNIFFLKLDTFIYICVCCYLAGIVSFFVAQLFTSSYHYCHSWLQKRRITRPSQTRRETCRTGDLCLAYSKTTTIIAPFISWPASKYLLLRLLSSVRCVEFFFL